MKLKFLVPAIVATVITVTLLIYFIGLNQAPDMDSISNVTKN